MSKENKAKIIDGIEEEFNKCTIGILTDYRGLGTSQLTAVRRKVQEHGLVISLFQRVNPCVWTLYYLNR